MSEGQENHAIERLSLLLYVGYEIQGKAFPSDSITLKHPSKKEKFRDAYLYADGMVVFPIGANDERRFFSDCDRAEFEEFIYRVSRPTWWQKRAEIDGLAYFYLMLMIVLLIAWGLSQSG